MINLPDNHSLRKLHIASKVLDIFGRTDCFYHWLFKLSFYLTWSLQEDILVKIKQKSTNISTFFAVIYLWLQTEKPYFNFFFPDLSHNLDFLRPADIFSMNLYLVFLFNSFHIESNRTNHSLLSLNSEISSIISVIVSNIVWIFFTVFLLRISFL